MRVVGVRAVHSTPMVSPSGPLLGLMSTHYPVPSRPSAAELRWMRCLAQYGADGLARPYP